MHILCISLTGNSNEGARTVQFSKVVRSIQMQGNTVSVITLRNQHLKEVDPGSGTFCFLPGELDNSSGITDRARKKLWKIKGLLHHFGSPIVREAIRAAERIIRGKGVDCIFTSSHPVFSHMVGLYLKRRTGLPWVASFSDPHPSAMLPEPYGGRFMSPMAHLEKYFVKKVFRASDAVHMPTDVCLDIAGSFIKVDIEEKAFAIPPVGETDYGTRERSSNGFLVHTGRAKRRISEDFLSAVREFRERQPEELKGLIFVGRYGEKVRDLAQKLSMEDDVKTIEQVTHGKALGYISGGKAVAILEAPMNLSHALPSKFAEAAFSGKPILAVTPEKSPVRNYLEKFGGGVAVTHNKEDVIRGLEIIFSKKDDSTANGLQAQKDLATQFSYNTVGGKYHKMFHKVIGKCAG